jgi:hypothetical protein
MSLDADAPDGGAEAGATAWCGDGIVEEDEQCDPGPIAGEGGTQFCVGCQVICPLGFVWSRNNHCYMNEGVTGTFTGANNACVALNGYAHVVTFASDDEYQAVTGHFASENDAGPFWVGIGPAPNHLAAITSLIGPEPGWSSQCSGCYARAADPSQALPRTPEAGLLQDCIRGDMDPNAATWWSYPCASALPLRLRVVCEREPEGVRSMPCEAGTCIDLLWTHGAKSYVYLATAMTADQAATACHSLGGMLVVLQSRDEREQLWRELSQLMDPPMSIWVGLAAGDGGWFWDDTTPSDQLDAYPPPWAVNQPLDAGTTRAYLLADDQRLDNTLAHTEAQQTLPAVCQLMLP